MKTRLGFVSNSSSTSFAVACDKNKKTPVQLRVVIELNDFVTNVIHNQEELEEYIKDNFCAGDRTLQEFFEKSDLAKETYDEYLELLNEGKVIHIGSLSSDAESGTEQFLYQNGIESFLDAGEGEVVFEGC